MADIPDFIPAGDEWKYPQARDPNVDFIPDPKPAEAVPIITKKSRKKKSD